MIGVRFTKPMAPFGAGDTALLPDDVARKIVDRGEGELCRFPTAPHAAAFSEAPANKAMQVETSSRTPGRRLTYKSKGA